LEYILAGNKDEECVFCKFPRLDNDRDNHILLRGEHSFVIMNAFPYSNGHLLVPPYRHIADMSELTDEESLEIMQLTRRSINALKAACRPDGFNVGLNLGTAAGAGIADHMHLHIVPRWNGDINFMPVFADIKVIPEALAATYDRLKAEFDKE
jgi:ATP adenylyltransferase